MVPLLATRESEQFSPRVSQPCTQGSGGAAGLVLPAPRTHSAAAQAPRTCAQHEHAAAACDPNSRTHSPTALVSPPTPVSTRVWRLWGGRAAPDWQTQRTHTTEQLRKGDHQGRAIHIWPDSHDSSNQSPQRMCCICDFRKKISRNIMGLKQVSFCVISFPH